MLVLKCHPQVWPLSHHCRLQFFRLQPLQVARVLGVAGGEVGRGLNLVRPIVSGVECIQGRRVAFEPSHRVEVGIGARGGNPLKLRSSRST